MAPEDSQDTEAPQQPDPAQIAWDIRRKGRAWGAEEAMPRYQLTPEKLEMINGRLLWEEQDRLLLLGLLLENVGAVRLGDPAVWREAVHRLG